MRQVADLPLPWFHSPEEEKEYERDCDLALRLLSGIPLGNIKRGPATKWDFLSSKTTPTEKEARAALSRVLRVLAFRIDGANAGHGLLILKRLAELFTPAEKPRYAPPRKLIFKRLNQGHPKPDRNSMIAYCVQDLRDKNRTYDEATQEVADKFGVTQRQAQRIYRKYRDSDSPTSVKGTDDTTSDR